MGTTYKITTLGGDEVGSLVASSEESAREKARNIMAGFGTRFSALRLVRIDKDGIRHFIGCVYR